MNVQISNLEWFKVKRGLESVSKRVSSRVFDLKKKMIKFGLEGNG